MGGGGERLPIWFPPFPATRNHLPVVIKNVLPSHHPTEEVGLAHVAPAIPLPNIPGSTQSTSEWESALLDAVEGYYTDSPSPWTIGRPRIIETFYESHVAPIPSFAAHEPGVFVDVGDPPLPMEPWVFGGELGQGARIYPVVPRQMAERNPPVSISPPRPEPISKTPPGKHDHASHPHTMVVEDPIEIIEGVTEYEEGDWPSGSIFAPGEVWGPAPGGPNQLDESEYEETDMAHDWGHLLRQGIEGLGGFSQPAAPTIYSPYMPGLSPTAIPGGSAASSPGAAVVLDQYGRPCRRRRRRRRLLTNSDLKDLAALKTITGNNDALKMAVIKAVR